MPDNINRRLSDLERREAKIEAQEAEILATDQHILEKLEEGKSQSGLIAALYRHRFWISLLLMVGVALVWKAVGELSDALPVVSTAVGALLAGLAILALIDYLTSYRKK